jgi:hypothetical protein
MPQLAIKDLGPCQVEWNGISIGRTFGGVKFKYTVGTAPVKEDQEGEAAVDDVTIGATNCTVETPCSRSTLFNINRIIHRSTLAAPVLTVLNSVGQDLYDLAKILILKPWENGAASATATQWVTIFKAYPIVDAEVVYDNAGQRIFKIIWHCYPTMESGADFEKFWKMGA